MAIHINFKEVGARLADIDQLAKIAQVLSAANAASPIVYFEFENAEQLAYFCKAVKMLPFVTEIDELEKERDKLTTEISKLDMKKRKKSA